MKAQADPNLIVYFDGQYMPMHQANVGILTHALHYGTGVFEGIRAYWDPDQHEMFLLRCQEHYHRWKSNCRILRIEVPLSPQQLTEISLDLIRRNEFRASTYLRPLAFKCAQGVGVGTDDQDAFAIVALPFGDYFNNDRGLSIAISSWRRVEDNAIPARAKICGAYVNSALATDDARRSGFDEALMLNEDGHVAEGATCNLLMVRKGDLITPPVNENVLEGITRDSVIELAERELGLRAVERPIDRSELYIADELFFTGTAVGVMPIASVDHRPIGSGGIGSVTAQIRHLYFEATRGHLPAYRKWLVPAYGSQQAHNPGAASQVTSVH